MVVNTLGFCLSVKLLISPLNLNKIYAYFLESFCHILVLDFLESYASIQMIILFFIFKFVNMACHIDLHMLKHPCIPREKRT